MEENVKLVYVKKTDKRYFKTDPIWQYDVGHVLDLHEFDTLPETFQVHFSHDPSGDAVTQIGQNGACSVPDSFVQVAKTIYAWIYVATVDTGLTKYFIEMPVARKSNPSDQEPEPVEQSVIDQAVAALNAGVDRAEDVADVAEAAQAGAEAAEQGAITAQQTAQAAARTAADKVTEAAAQVNLAKQEADRAETAAQNAEGSATAAAGSATSAASFAQSATSASQAAAQSARATAQAGAEADRDAKAAAASAATATSEAANAAQSASQAEQAVQDASEQADRAEQAAEDAETAKAGAETARTGAETAQSAAAGSATAAAGSATAAQTSAGNAASSATAAAGSAQAAAQTASQFEQDITDLKSALSNSVNPIMHGNNLYISGWTINSVGNWHAATGWTAYIFSVTPGDTLNVLAGTYAAQYTFLKEYTMPSEGGTPVYATGYTKLDTKGNEFSLNVPSDASLLFVLEQTSNNILPVWIKSKNYNYILSNVDNYNNNSSNVIKVDSYPTPGYVNTQGSLVTGGAWATTDYFPYDKLEQAYVKTYQIPGTLALASFYDINKTFVYGIDTVPGTSGSGNDKRGFLSLTGVPSNAKYVRFSTNSPTTHYAILTYKISELALQTSKTATELSTNTIDSNLTITTFNPDGYINMSGDLITGPTQTNWVYTDYVSAQNVEGIRSKAYQYPGAVALVAFYDENKIFISAVDTYDGQTGSGVKEGSIAINQIPSNAVFMCFTSRTAVEDKYVAIKYDYTGALRKVISDVPDIQAQVNEVSATVNRLYGYPFKIAFIGDSLTYGQTYVHAQGTAGYAYKNKANYPDAFCRMLDADEKTVIAIPGANPGGVWNAERDAISAIQNQFVIIWLGTNGGLTDTVNTDCVGTNVDNYADTNTGNYGKIIQTLVSHGNKVFLAQLCYSAVIQVSNPVIVKLAQRFSCSVLNLSSDDITELNKDKYHTAYNGYVNSVHFNSVGYNHVASIFFARMMSAVYADPAAFEIYMEDS